MKGLCLAAAMRNLAHVNTVKGSGYKAAYLHFFIPGLAENAIQGKHKDIFNGTPNGSVAAFVQLICQGKTLPGCFVVMHAYLVAGVLNKGPYHLVDRQWFIIGWK